MVYNGEMYNYHEVRRSWRAAASGGSGARHRGGASSLALLGHPGGAEVPRHVRVRARRPADRRAVPARDPLGIKPLYYPTRGDGVLFASELRALTAAVGPELRVEPGALVASMLYYWVPEQFCAIEGVRKLPAGLGPAAPGRPPPGGAVLERRRRGPRRWPHGPAPDLGRVIEDSVTATWSPTCRCAPAPCPVAWTTNIITVRGHRPAQEIDDLTITSSAEDQAGGLCP